MRYSILLPTIAIAISPAGLAAAPNAQPAPAAKAVAVAGTVDPERLAIAREIARSFWPDGTIKQMMSSMSGMQSGMMSDMMNKTPQELGVSDAKAEGKTLGQLAREKDPYFQERLEITQRVMMEEMGEVMASAEPEMREGMARLYARRLSTKELSDILAFFRTPSGKTYASQLMPMMSDPEFQKSMAGLAPKIMQAMPGIMEKVQKATSQLPPPPTENDETKAAVPPTT